MKLRIANTPSLPANRKKRQKTGVDDYARARGHKELARKLKQAEAAPTVDGPVDELRTRQGSAIKMERDEFLWKPYIPKAKLSGSVGYPGAGKSFVALAVAASLSRGKEPYSDRKCEPVVTLYMSFEGDPETVILPRFTAMDGDPKRLFIVDGAKGSDGKPCTFTLADVSAIEKTLRQHKVGLVILDPLQSFLGAKLDMHRANETRPIFDGLKHAAKRTGAAIHIIRHARKDNGGGRGVNAGLGSQDIAGALRSEFLVGTAHDEHVMIHSKPCESAPRGVSLAFVLEKATVKASTNGAIETARVVWKGESTVTVKELLEAEKPRTKALGPQAVEWLRNTLRVSPRLATELSAEWAEWSGQELANAERTLQNACKQMKVKRSRKGKSGPWMWEMIPQKFEADRGYTRPS